MAFARLLAQLIKLRVHCPDFIIKTIRLDNAGEFTSQTFNDFCMSIGISVEHPVAHVHTQNGLAESLIKHLQLIARPLLMKSKLPISVLGHAILHAASLIREEKLKNSRAANEVEGYGHDLIVSERQVLDWNTRLFLRVCPENERNLNLWPENPHNFSRDILHAYSPNVKQMMDLLFKAMAKSLDLEKNSFSGQFGDNPVMQVRFNFYPHMDRSGVTVLLQDEEVEGLQIVKDGAWITVPLIPRALVVNLGNQMQILSNRIFKSPVHKAVTNTDKPRISVAMSNEAEVDKEIGPVEALIDD
ncbi:protein SRG1-like [Gossypium hirsutum]|uniref:Protein SRG1-like n=1 Tax=Gossypium hirsutum TaxID=3635 RepID=A0A1U8IT15_GOSHI|nr:protein SRG1-like [Gossypium hirsutum]